MIIHCKANLLEIKNLISKLDQRQYQHNSKLLSEANIGQHIRHILEFYKCLLNGVGVGIVNYDKRERNLSLENNPEDAIYTIDKICNCLTFIEKNEEIILVGNFSAVCNNSVSLKTTLFRELAYCLEHSIHHQALIKVSLQEQNIGHLIDDAFGVAPSTIRFRPKKRIPEPI